MYLIGRFNNRASVIKFSKNSMNIDWKVQIGSSELYQAAPNKGSYDLKYPTADMNEIYAFVQPKKSNKIYACGYRYKDLKATEKRTASMFKMDDQGEIQFLYMFGTRDTNKQAD